MYLKAMEDRKIPEVRKHKGLDPQVGKSANISFRTMVLRPNGTQNDGMFRKPGST